MRRWMYVWVVWAIWLAAYKGWDFPYTFPTPCPKKECGK